MQEQLLNSIEETLFCLECLNIFEDEKLMEDTFIVQFNLKAKNMYQISADDILNPERLRVMKVVQNVQLDL